MNLERSPRRQSAVQGQAGRSGPVSGTTGTAQEPEPVVRRLKPQILPARACVCGHPQSSHDSDHECYACGQNVHVDEERCQAKDCHCEEYVRACQNCGEAAHAPLRRALASEYDICSRRCALQLEYAVSLLGEAA